MSVGAVNKNTGDRIPTAGMPAIDDALDLTSVNPVQNAVITAALANKQDKTDNNLDTTAKTIVGAINEHEGDISSLMSGLTNVDVALSVPENTGKNVLPLTLANLKDINTSGTWNGNAYIINGVTFTVQTDSDGNVTSIVANGVATNKVWFRLVPTTFDIMNGTILSGITNGSRDTFSMYAFESNDLTVITQLTNGEYTFTNNYENVNMYINILSGVTVDNITFYPMLRPAGTTPTFAPYIPSVESRIEAVDFGILPNAVNFLPSVTIDACQLWKNGKVVNGNIKFTTSETITSGNFILSGMPKISTIVANSAAMGAVSFNKSGAFGGLANTSDGAYGAVFLTADLSAGTYCASFSYISV